MESLKLKFFREMLPFGRKAYLLCKYVFIFVINLEINLYWAYAKRIYSSPGMVREIFSLLFRAAFHRYFIRLALVKGLRVKALPHKDIKLVKNEIFFLKSSINFEHYWPIRLHFHL